MSAVDTWQLKIPVRLSLSSSEITSPVDVKPVYLLAPRHAYLPALAERCLSFFQHVLLSLPGQSTATPWFEYEGLALNWSQPLGVLHDLLAPTPAPTAAATTAGSTATPASFNISSSPWCLIVHYQNMPAAIAHSWQNAGTAKDLYFSSLKEAGYCCRGSDGSGAVMRLPGAAQDELWSAVNKGDGQAVQAVLNQMKVQPMQKPGAGSCSIPVRVYIRQHNSYSGDTGVLGVWDKTFSTSRPIDITQPDGSATMLAHVISLLMPQQFPSLRPLTAGASEAPAGQQQQQTNELIGQDLSSADVSKTEESDNIPQFRSQTAATDGHIGVASTDDPSNADASSHSLEAATARSPGESQSAVGAEALPAAALDDAVAEKQRLGAAEHVLPPDWPDQGVCVLVCGVQPDWCTTLAWLYAHMRSADGFLYIVVHVSTDA